MPPQTPTPEMTQTMPTPASVCIWSVQMAGNGKTCLDARPTIINPGALTAGHTFSNAQPTSDIEMCMSTSCWRAFEKHPSHSTTALPQLPSKPMHYQPKCRTSSTSPLPLHKTSCWCVHHGPIQQVHTFVTST